MQKMRYTLLAGTTVVLGTVGLSACGGSTNAPATPTATTSGAPSAPSNGAAAARGGSSPIGCNTHSLNCHNVGYRHVNYVAGRDLRLNRPRRPVRPHLGASPAVGTL